MPGQVILINPHLVVQRNDPLTTGIVYMPILLAYAAAALREAGFEPQVIDAYGEAPYASRRHGDFLVFGLDEPALRRRIKGGNALVFVYAINCTNHLSVIEIIRSLREAYPTICIVVMENTQAVTGFRLNSVAQEFYSAGADFILTGDSEKTIVELAERWRKGELSEAELASMAGLGSRAFFTPARILEESLDSFPFPAWELFPLQNYWRLRFAHGPLSSRRYLPLLTSRGCPFQCRFCVAPAMGHQKWRARSAVHVVDEMEYWQKQLGVDEFHVEDLNPTVSEDRIRDISREILSRGLSVTWKIVSGTKAETLAHLETVDLMAQAGCRYISISPETGSPRVLELMKKPFDLEHAISLVRRMKQNRIYSQACFVLGFPGETMEDLKMTCRLVKRLTREGIDEIALFIMTPVPGAELFSRWEGYRSLSELNFTPKWRKDYAPLQRFRIRLYFFFLLWKLCYHPLKFLAQIGRFFLRRFETKMEMVPYRALMLILHSLRLGHK